MRGLVVAMLLLVGGAARAQDPVTEARALHKEGTRLFELGRFDEAIAKYEAAYRLKDDPVILYNIAQAHRQAHHVERALFSYRAYLTRSPDAPNREQVQARIDELEAEVATERHRAELEAAGQGEDAQAQRQAAARDAAARDAAARDAAARDAARALGEARARRERIAGVALLGAGALVVVGGIVAGSIALSDGNAITSESQNALHYDPAHSSEGQLADRLGIALDCIGGAAIAAGVVVTTLGYRGRARRFAVVPRVGGGSAGLVVVGAF